MRFLKILGFIVAALLTLLIIAFSVIWMFNPFGPEVTLDDAAPLGKRINNGDLIANYYPVSGDGPNPAIVLLGGSEGGIRSERLATALQENGYAVLAISYFGAPGQTKILERVPLEIFDQGIDWLKSQPNVDADRLGIMGASKGAEAALIISTRHPEIKAVVAGMPSHVAWQGYNPNLLKQIFTPPDGSWAHGGIAIPFIPYVQEYVEGPLELYEKSLLAAPDFPEAFIPVENTAAQILLVCGEVDALWPSCDMARQIRARAMDKQGPNVTLLAYERAGHGGFGLPVDIDHPRFEVIGSIGGTPEDNNAAREDSWPKVLKHFRDVFELDPESALVQTE